MKIVVENLLRYFDDPTPDEKGKGDATTLVQVFGEDMGAELFAQHLRQEWGDTTILTNSCTTGCQKGPRLDRWLQTTRENRQLLIQLEIKGWSAHAIGGRNLPLDATAENLEKHRKDRWLREWDEDKFKKPQAGKVLVAMKPPDKLKVEPAICYWDAMHRDGKDEPLFKVDLSDDSNFQHVWVFSASTYLRSLRKKRVTELDLQMPNAERRIELLRWIAPPSP